jgi:hypothetical protein
MPGSATAEYYRLAPPSNHMHFSSHKSDPAAWVSQDFNPLVAKFVHVPPKAAPLLGDNGEAPSGAGANTSGGTAGAPSSSAPAWVSLMLPEEPMLDPKLIVFVWGAQDA